MAPPAAGKRYFMGLALIGGHPALDLVNSVKYRGRPDPQDTLCSFRQVVDWARIARIIEHREVTTLHRLATQDPRACDVILTDIHSLRENLRCILEPGNRRSAPRKKAAAALEDVIEALRPAARIDPGAGTLTRGIPIHEPADLHHRLVLSAVELMETSPMPPIGCCAASDCDWLFIDRSKTKRRRWCDTGTCGNRARVRRFRAGDPGSRPT